MRFRRSALPIAFLLLCLFWTLAPAPPAAAHAYLSASSPKQESVVSSPPSEISVTFTEEIEAGVSSLALFDEAGNEMPGALSSDGSKTLRLAVDGLADGVYRVRWQVLSVDSHTTDGSFRFSVGTPLESSRPQETVSLDGEAPTVEAPAKPTEEPAASTPPAQAQPPAEEAPDEQVASTAPDAPPTASEPPLPSRTPADAPVVGDKSEGGDRPEAADEPSAPSDGVVADAPSDDAPDGAAADEPVAPTSAVDAPASAAIEHDHATHESAYGSLPIPTLRTLLRIVDVLTLATLGGVLAFRALLFAAPAAAGLAPAADDWRRRTAASAFVVFALTGTLHAALLSSQLDAVSFGDVWLRTSVGTAALARIGCAAAMLALAWRRGGRPWTIALSAVLYALLSWTFPATGHAAAAEANRALALGAHAGHIVAAAAWYGGLLGIAIAAVRTTTQGALQLVGAFSKAALPLMLVAAASGLLLANAQLPSIADLTTSTYGGILLAKLALFALVLALGAFHRWVLLPGLRPEAPTDRRLVAGIRIEVALAIALFTVAGWLSTTSPPTAATSADKAGPFHWHVMGDIAHMTIDATTPVAGETTPLTADIWVPDGTGGAPTEPPELVLVTLIPPGASGGLQYELRPAPDEAAPYVFEGYTKTHYAAAQPIALDRSGDWAIAVVFVVPGQRAIMYESKLPVR
ncbi:copper resistance protein CopC [Paenibacillus sp.]|uniref:copper resistance CopC/CopD family protein n=1 Tax=Paenibacillus sp. TaxID=58172 RepID=UPI0028117C00|nr:copper resistance protein CopC [Paenibacillus sp.]